MGQRGPGPTEVDGGLSIALREIGATVHRMDQVECGIDAIKGPLERLRPEQIANASADVKAKYEQTRDQLKADYEVRSAKRSDAAQLTKEALT